MAVNDISPELLEKRIFLIRGQKVMLDMHLAELYGVETKALNGLSGVTGIDSRRTFASC